MTFSKLGWEFTLGCLMAAQKRAEQFRLHCSRAPAQIELQHLLPHHRRLRHPRLGQAGAGDLRRQHSIDLIPDDGLELLLGAAAQDRIASAPLQAHSPDLHAVASTDPPSDSPRTSSTAIVSSLVRLTQIQGPPCTHRSDDPDAVPQPRLGHRVRTLPSEHRDNQASSPHVDNTVTGALALRRKRRARLFRPVTRTTDVLD